jgi:hypothetical protein
MNFNLLANSTSVETIIKDFTLSEIKKALAEKKIVLVRKFTDPCKKENVDRLVDLMKNDSTLVITLSNYMRQQKSSAPMNILEVGTHIPVTATCYTLSPEKVSYEALSESGEIQHGVVHCCNGVVTQKEGSWDPVSVFAKITVACTSTTGKDIKAKGPAKPDDYSIPPSWAVAASSMLTEGGKPTDVAMKIFFSMRKDATPDVRHQVMSLFNSTIPMTKRGGSEKLVDLINCKRRRPTPDYISNKFSFFGIRTILDNLKGCLSSKGQGKFARDSYLGIPLGDLGKILQHKVTLDDAGAVPGMSILVDSTDILLINFLRCNYGSKIVGRGTGYPMLTDMEINSTNFDCVYVPKPINMTYGGKDVAVGSMFTMLRKKMLEQLDIKVKGKLICHLSPAVFFDKTYHDAFYKCDVMECVSKIEMAETVGTRKPVENHANAYGTLDIKNAVDEEWTPKPILDRSKLIVQIARMYRVPISNPTIFGMMSRSVDDDDLAFGAQELQLIANDISRHPIANKAYISAYTIAQSKEDGTISAKVVTLPNYQTFTEPYILSKEAFDKCKAPVRVSMESWKGTLLYSELLDDRKVSDQMTQMMVYMRHCIRSNFNCVPFVNSSYKINKIFSVVGKDYFGFDDSYGDMMVSKITLMMEEESFVTLANKDLDTMVEKIEHRLDDLGVEDGEKYEEDPDAYGIALSNF